LPLLVGRELVLAEAKAPPPPSDHSREVPTAGRYVGVDQVDGAVAVVLGRALYDLYEASEGGLDSYFQPTGLSSIFILRFLVHSQMTKGDKRC
jgi:hypothetical protein